MALSSHSKAAAYAILDVPSPPGNYSAPAIDGFEFRGLGWCMSARGSFFSYNTIPDVPTAETCAESCEGSYSSDEKFAGINFHPGWFGSPNCNCMMMDVGSNTVITGANGWNEELCYSWNEAQDLPPAAEVPAPAIDGFEFRGMGCCANSQGMLYSYKTISGDTVEECAASCEEKYSSNEHFVGINFHPDWFGNPNCNCMMDTTFFSGEPLQNGPITGVGGWCYEELCYSYNQADDASVTA